MSGSWLRDLDARLKALQAERAGDPELNPVKRLAHELSAQFEADGGLDGVADLIKALGDAAAMERGAALGAYTDVDEARGRVLAALNRAADEGLAAFTACVERPRMGVVFTAHPTFAASPAMYAAIAAVADRDPDADAQVRAAPHDPAAAITLTEEHAAARAAVAQAWSGVDAVNALIAEVARERFPEAWRALTPRLATVATWVGYDLDGRTDIHWGQTVRFRLEEKAGAFARLGARLARLSAPPSDLIGEIAAAGHAAAEAAAAFDVNLEDPAAAAAAANALTHADAPAVSRAGPLLERLSALIETAEADDAEALWRARAELAASGLGEAHIHLRVNAAQVCNAVRDDLGAVQNGRTALRRAADAAAEVEPRRVNFASVFLERTTARRQFMLTAQILKHIDADAPVRFLIAETENAFTVMAAIYMARLYGVADRVDISPLFETQDALERGGRLMEQLLDTPEYLAYARTRGRIAIQIGWSDSGRFMGQIAAGLAAERLQILLARALERRGIDDLDVVIFNTHGESMGRGAHPGSMTDRARYLFSPWARARYAKAGVATIHETSFQGGDGFVHFATQTRAQATVMTLAADALATHSPDRDDRFYADINFSWDFYQALKAWQHELYEHPDYRAALGALGRNLLVKTGSRKTKRQSDGAAAEGPRSLRAIPHNAILQQLGAPLNVAGGVGAASAPERDRFLEMVASSPRAQIVMGMAGAARVRASVLALRGYAAILDPAYWTARAFAPWSTPRAPDAAAATLADRLKAMRRTGALARLANLASSDLAAFDAVWPAAHTPQAGAVRARLHLMHAVRLALMMRAMLLAARIPEFSPRHDVTRGDLIDAVIDQDVERAAAILEDVFPKARPEASLAGAVKEPGDAVADNAGGYPEIHAAIVEPLRDTADLIRRITVTLGHVYSAYG